MLGALRVVCDDECTGKHDQISSSRPNWNFDLSDNPQSLEKTTNVSGGTESVWHRESAPWVGVRSLQDCEELAYNILAALPRSRLAIIQRRIAPLLQFDVVGSLPTEVSLQIFSHLTATDLLKCALVNRRWRTLANDQTLWKTLCHMRGWEWRQPFGVQGSHPTLLHTSDACDDSDDEGMGDSDEDADDGANESFGTGIGDVGLDSGFASMSLTLQPVVDDELPLTNRPPLRPNSHPRFSAPPPTSQLKVNYKLLHQTHIRLHNRFLSSSYRLSALQTRGAPTDSHTNTIYCLQLYTYPSTGTQVLFTGSRDRTVREWNLTTGLVERVISGVHESSVLSICVHKGFVASAGSDRRVVVWDLGKNRPVKVICDHEDSVLCVRFDDERLVSCSKDRTVRTYKFPDLTPQFVLGAHRAAVNVVSISKTLIVSGSGDRSIRLWDAATGKLLRTFENHHTRGIASIDFKPPYVLSGSSDKHIRLFDITSLQGWSTSPEQYEGYLLPATPSPFGGSRAICQTCGSATGWRDERPRLVHGDLVRSVALNEGFVISGSYDLSIKVWDRKTGVLVADLTGGHTGRIFCVGYDSTKIVSCGEDQRICVWDFSHGIDVSFVVL